MPLTDIKIRQAKPADKPLAVFLAPEAAESLALLRKHGIAAFRTPEACADALAAFMKVLDGYTLKDLIEPLDLLVGFLKMVLQTLRQVAVGGLLDHLRQRLGDLLLGVIDILQAMQQQVVHRLDVF